MKHKQLLTEKKNFIQREKNLRDVKKVLDNLNVRFWLYEGALLGFYRDGKFISWDWDLDFLVFSEEIYPHLTEVRDGLVAFGFQATIASHGNNGTVKRSKIDVIRGKERLSLNSYFLNEITNTRVRVPYRFPARLFNPGTFIEINGVKYPCPAPIEEYLELAYGDWKTPIKTSDPDDYRRGRKSGTAEQRYLKMKKDKVYHYYTTQVYQGYDKQKGD